MTGRYFNMLEIFAHKDEVEQSWNLSPTNGDSTDVIRTSVSSNGGRRVQNVFGISPLMQILWTAV
jgi:hypothetical protein